MKKTKIIAIVLAIALVAAMVLGLVACNKSQANVLRVAAPEGTPALAIAHMVTNKLEMGGYKMEYAIVAPNQIASEMASEKAGIVIMPINAGVKQIIDGAPYKLLSIAVDGSLYIIGHKEGDNTITMNDLKGKTIASIGQGAVPGLTLKYVLSSNDITPIEDGTPTDEQVKIQWIADGPAAAALLTSGQVDYALVGEPAATALPNKINQDSNGTITINGKMNIQTEYQTITGDATFPQAGLFIKTNLLANNKLVEELFKELAENKQWVLDNASTLTAYAQANLYGTAAFPAPAVPRCAINCSVLDEAKKTVIVNYLDRIMPVLHASENKAKIF